MTREFVVVPLMIALWCSAMAQGQAHADAQTTTGDDQLSSAESSPSEQDRHEEREVQALPTQATPLRKLSALSASERAAVCERASRIYQSRTGVEVSRVQYDPKAQTCQFYNTSGQPVSPIEETATPPATRRLSDLKPQERAEVCERASRIYQSRTGVTVARAVYDSKAETCQLYDASGRPVSPVTETATPPPTRRLKDLKPKERAAVCERASQIYQSRTGVTVARAVYDSKVETCQLYSSTGQQIH